MQQHVDSWPVAEWGGKDLSTICVMAGSRIQVTRIYTFNNTLVLYVLVCR